MLQIPQDNGFCQKSPAKSFSKLVKNPEISKPFSGQAGQLPSALKHNVLQIKKIPNIKFQLQDLIFSILPIFNQLRFSL